MSVNTNDNIYFRSYLKLARAAISATARAEGARALQQSAGRKYGDVYFNRDCRKNNIDFDTLLSEFKVRKERDANLN